MRWMVLAVLAVGCGPDPVEACQEFKQARDACILEGAGEFGADLLDEFTLKVNCNNMAVGGNQGDRWAIDYFECKTERLERVDCTNEGEVVDYVGKEAQQCLNI